MKQDDASASRRQFVGGMTAGLAAAFVSPVFGQQGQQGQQESRPAGSLHGPSRSGKQDPTTQYPIPPFPPQKQELPGLVSRMIPRPDHGETTYKGLGRLLGRKALLTGGDSGKETPLGRPANQPNWRLCMSCLRRRNRAMQPDKCMVPQVEKDNLSALMPYIARLADSYPANVAVRSMVGGPANINGDAYERKF